MVKTFWWYRLCALSALEFDCSAVTLDSAGTLDASTTRLAFFADTVERTRRFFAP